MTTVPTTTLSEADLALITTVHGHLCPMVLLGARTARRARYGLGTAEHLFGYYRGYGCAVDGIQIFSGCTWGNGNLVLLRGRNFSFVLTPEGARAGIEVAPRSDVLHQVRGDRAPGSRSRIMDLFRSGPDEELFSVGEVRDLGALSGFPEE